MKSHVIFDGVVLFLFTFHFWRREKFWLHFESFGWIITV